MASITFRLKSSSHVGTISMEGTVITCREIQEAVALKLSAPAEEICVFMADSKDLLHPEEDIPAYSIVDIVRQTYTGKPIFKPRQPIGGPSPLGANGGGRMAAGKAPADGADANRPLTEEERLAQLQAEVTMDTGIDEVSGRYRRGGGGGRGGGGAGGFGGGAHGGGGASGEDSFRPPPPGYVCHNCGKGGHLIQHCPAAKGGKHMKVLSLPFGIPESMLVECTMDDPAPKFITRDHRLVKRKLDTGAFAAVAMLSPTTEDAQADRDLSTSENNCETQPNGVDDATSLASASLQQYLCVVDKVVAKEAMKLPCCEKLMCKACFDALVEEALTRDFDAEPLACPGCEEPLLMDDVEPATEEREAIQKHLTSRKRQRVPGE